MVIQKKSAVVVHILSGSVDWKRIRAFSYHASAYRGGSIGCVFHGHSFLKSLSRQKMTSIDHQAYLYNKI